MADAFNATNSIVIAVPAAKVWEALTTPALIKQYMFGAEVISDWKLGSTLLYRGLWEGKPYEDKGTILQIEPNKVLQASYFSPLSGLDDKPENYNTVTYALAPEDKGTRLTVTQTNNPSAEAASRAQANWGTTLASIKDLLEKV